MKRSFYRSITAVMILCIGLGSCNKLISVGPPENQLVSGSVFADTSTAEAAVLGMYSKAGNANPAVDMGAGTSLYNGLSSDEGSYPFNSLYAVLTQNAVTSSFVFDDIYWTMAYNTIYVANALIAGDSASSLPQEYKSRTIGEAKFIRAYTYFILVNEYGAVPLVLTSDVQVATSLPRDSVSVVYAQIIKDLTDAEAVLPTNLTLYAGSRTRATSWAAEALLARVYLYTGQWAQAETASTAVINNPGLFSLQTDLTKVFLATNTEGIMPYISALTSSWMASVLAGYSFSVTPSFVMSDSLMAAFETGDLRLANWVGYKSYGGINYPYPSKYKYLSGVGAVEDDQVLRLSEQYLIRAEARTRQGNLSGAAADLNVIRNRAGLGNTTAGDELSMMQAIEHENRIEFFVEWGHRWMDMNRWPGYTNASLTRADEEYPIDKTTGWQHYDALYPIPLQELSTNPNLTQNPGY